MTTRVWAKIGFVVRQLVYQGSVVRDPGKRADSRHQPTHRNLSVQGPSSYHPGNHVRAQLT